MFLPRISVRVQSVKQGYYKCGGMRANDRNLILDSCEVSSRNEVLRAVGSSEKDSLTNLRTKHI